MLPHDIHDVSPCCIYGRCEEVGEEMGADEFNCQLEPRPPVRRPCYSPCVGECVVSEWTEWSRCKQVGNSTLLGLQLCKHCLIIFVSFWYLIIVITVFKV